MAGIISKILKPIYYENKYNFNAIELCNDFDLNIGEAFFRYYDSQTGRWWQIDPKPTESESLYSGIGNNPILRNDPLGDTSIYNEQGVRIATFGTNDINYLIKTTKTTSQLGSSDPGTVSNPISKQEAQRTEYYLSEASLWSEAAPVDFSPVKNNIVKIKNTEQIQTAEKNVSADDGKGGSKSQNNREYFGTFTAQGANVLTGAVADPSKGKPAVSKRYGRIDYHSHPSGSKSVILPDGGSATASWNQPPSGQDIKTAKGTEYVFAMGVQLIFVYDSKGVSAIVPMGSIKK